ncbi:MAG: FkbM family methyltransferase [Pseudomonadota bacterium]
MKFVQIGAADGRRADPIFSFVRRFGWRGVLCEPLPDLFGLLKRNYQGQEGLIFENVAITEKVERRVIHRVPLNRVGRHGVPAWAFGASSFVPEKTGMSGKSDRGSINNFLVPETVDCIPLATLLERNNVQELDVLQLDTEGYDANILKQLDFSRHRATIINMEWQWLTKTEQDDVLTLLRNHGYHTYFSEGDLLATAVPLETLRAPATAPTLGSVPRYFPGLIGLVDNIEIDPVTGAAAGQPVLCEIFGSRGQRIPVRGEPAMLRCLGLIDGKRTYLEIAQEIGCSQDQIIEWARQLIECHVIE